MTDDEGRQVAEAAVRDILDGYFRHTLRIDLDQDIPACAADIMALVTGDNDLGAAVDRALWHAVDRAWSRRWEADQAAYKRQLDAVQGYLAKRSKYGDDEATELLTEE